MPIRDRNGVFPPGGWQFFEPAINWHAPVGLRFVECVDAIIKIRLANPRFNLSTDWHTVADTLDTFTCHRINFDPHYCFSATEAQKKTLHRGNDQPLSPAKPEAAGLVAGIKSYAQGAQILTEWLGEGATPVSQDLSESRAKTCIPCPFNVRGNWKTKVGKKVAEAILEQLRVKDNMALRVTGEKKLGTCNACLCHLPLKVQVPLNHILKNTSQETLDALHPDCWVLSESKKKILCVIPFHNGDVKLAEKLLEWIKELGGCQNHSCLLLADAKVTEVWVKHIISLASAAFRSVSFIRGPAEPDLDGWPIGPNWMHKTARDFIATKSGLPWLWLEPDAVPLKSGWLDALQSEYDLCRKQCLGAVIEPEEKHLKKYLAGVAVYPGDARPLFGDVTEHGGAFDVAKPDLIVPHSHPSQLIQHRWGIKNLPPVFKQYVSPGDPHNTLTLAAISKQAVLFHRCKDGSLIDVLREARTIAKRPPRPKDVIPMVAHIDMSSGYGILSVQTAIALSRLGLKVELYPPSHNDIHGTIPQHVKAMMKFGENPHPWNFVLFPCVFQPGNLVMKDHVETAWFSMWESSRLTSKNLNLDKDFTKGINLLNRCKVAIVPCAWNASGFSSCGVDTPIRVCPLGADTEIFHEAPNEVNGRLIFGTAAKTAYGGVRKGFNLVVAAFKLAFPREQDVMLKVKSFSEDPPIDTGGDKRIDVLQLYLNQTQLVEWYKSINVFVSGSASEGWGRHQHEAMCMRRPVISVDFGGVSEFFSHENGYAVDWRLTPAEGIYETMGHYAKPSVESMAEQMRRVYSNRKELAFKADLAAQSARRFTLERSAKTLVSIFHEFNFLS